MQYELELSSEACSGMQEKARRGVSASFNARRRRKEGSGGRREGDERPGRGCRESRKLLSILVPPFTHLYLDYSTCRLGLSELSLHLLPSPHLISACRTLPPSKISNPTLLSRTHLPMRPLKLPSKRRNPSPPRLQQQPPSPCLPLSPLRATRRMNSLHRRRSRSKGGTGALV